MGKQMHQSAWVALAAVVASCSIVLLWLHGPQIAAELRKDEQLMSHLARAQVHAAVALAKGKRIRVNLLSPILQVLVAFTAFLSSLVAADRLFHFYVAIVWKLSGKRPEDEYQKAPLPALHDAGDQYPKVVVQIPMFNEREVIQSSCEVA